MRWSGAMFFLVRCLSFGAVVGCDVVLVPCLGSVEKVACFVKPCSWIMCFGEK